LGTQKSPVFQTRLLIPEQLSAKQENA